MSQPTIKPIQFKRLNFHIGWLYGLGLGVYISSEILNLDFIFFKIEIEYLSKKSVAEYNRMAEYFARRATVTDGEADKVRSIDLES